MSITNNTHTVVKKPKYVKVGQFIYGVNHPDGVNFESAKLDEGLEHPSHGSLGEVAFVTTAHEQRVYLTGGEWIFPEDEEGFFYPVLDSYFKENYEIVE